MGKKVLKIWESAALLALSFVLFVGTWAEARQQDIADGVIRLHVIAVSDDENEQALKLRVRDAVLDVLAPTLDGVSDKAGAEAALSDSLGAIRSAALSAAEGRSVSVSLGKELYPTRRYDGFTLPAGEYESLRVILGEGKGHNWWCVAFPPLCTLSAGGDELASVMSRESFSIVSEDEGYEIRFRAVELWGELKRWLKEVRN